MANLENLIDRIDTVRINFVSDQEFERVWGESLNEHAKKMMNVWDRLEAQARENFLGIR